MTTQQIWNTYNKDVKQFIQSKVKDEQIANDLLQDTFIKVHTKLDTLQELAKLKSWLFIITRNTVIDYLKQHSFSKKIKEETLMVIDELNEHNEKDCLHGILKNLPKKYRDPLFLSDIKGLKQAEVAKQLKLPLPTVKSQIQRARKLIAQGYMACCDFKMNEKGFLVGEIKEKDNCKVCS